MSLPDGPLTKGKAPEPRTRSEATQPLTEEEIVQAAKLRTQSTPETQPEEPVKVSTNKKKPWRRNVDISTDDLMVLTVKKTLNLPLELELRLEFIREKKRKGMARKAPFSALQIEALDRYTRDELEQLGYDVD